MNAKAKWLLLKEKSAKFFEYLAACRLCPRNCGVNRRKAELGICGANEKAVVYTAFKHFGEEPVLSGKAGSGTIFFSGCSLKCVYCQNYKFSHQLCGTPLEEAEFVRLLLALQKSGAHNINFVSPTHYLPQILKGITRATEEGLSLPLVYNTSGYEKAEIIKNLQGIIDIYLTDFKYFDEATAKRYSQASDYPLYAKESILQMYKQSKLCRKNSLLVSGLIIRHLVLPGHIDESKRILNWIKKHTPDALVSIMFQYQPYHKACRYTEINRTLRRAEYEEITTLIETMQLEGWVQDFAPQESLAGVHFRPSLNEFFPEINERGADCRA